MYYREKVARWGNISFSVDMSHWVLGITASREHLALGLGPVEIAFYRLLDFYED